MRILLVLLVVSAAAGHRLAGGGEAPSVGASTAVRLDVEGLLQHADLAVEARVVGVRTLEQPDGRIETEYELDVDRTFWGDDVPARAVRVPGGVLSDGRGMLVPGLPRLAAGERSLLFFSEASADGARMPVGLAQGRLRVASGADGDKVLVRELGALGLVDPGGTVHEPGALGVLDYADVLARLEAAAAARRAAAFARTEDE